jgi:hypothetical protein
LLLAVPAVTLTVVVSGICKVVLPLVPNVALPVPLLLIVRVIFTFAGDGFTVICTFAVPPVAIGSGEKESMVTVGIGGTVV